MQKIVDCAGLWYLGLAIGSSLTTIFHYVIKNKEFIGVQYFNEYPYLLAGIINAII